MARSANTTLYTFTHLGNYTARSGQREPPRLVLEVGGTSSTSLGGSHWPDPAVDCVGAECRDYHQDNLECLHTSHTHTPCCCAPIQFHTRVLQGVVTVKTSHFITHITPNITETVKRDADADAVQAATCSRNHSRQSAGTAPSLGLLISVHVKLSSCQKMFTGPLTLSSSRL